MPSLNRVQLIGNLGKDPELRRTQSGTAVVSFSVATTEKFKGKDGQQKEETEWHNCTAWNKSAEILAQYLKKGSSVYIEGKLKTRSWEDNGVKKYATDVVVREFQFLGGKQQGQQQNGDGGGFGEAPAGFDNNEQQQGEW